MTARLLMLELETLIDPENPTLSEREKKLNQEYQETIKPPVLVGEKSSLDMIRKNYVDNKIHLQMEGLPVNDETSAVDFWNYIVAVEAKIKRNTPKSGRNAIK
jgi:hypothetical protein